MTWLRQLFTRRQIYSDLSEEIQQHLAEKVEALMAVRPDGQSLMCESLRIRLARMIAPQQKRRKEHDRRRHS